jgi:hypothetical protein
MLGTEFEVSEESINWLFEELNRYIRIYVPKDFYTTETENQTPIGMVLKQLAEELKPFIVNISEIKSGIIYLQDFYTSFVPLFQDYVTDNTILVEQLVFDDSGTKSVRRVMDLTEIAKDPL